MVLAPSSWKYNGSDSSNWSTSKQTTLFRFYFLRFLIFLKDVIFIGVHRGRVTREMVSPQNSCPVYTLHGLKIEIFLKILKAHVRSPPPQINLVYALGYFHQLKNSKRNIDNFCLQINLFNYDLRTNLVWSLKMFFLLIPVIFLKLYIKYMFLCLLSE